MHHVECSRPDRLLEALAEEALSGPVSPDDSRSRIEQDDRIGQRSCQTTDESVDLRFPHAPSHGMTSVRRDEA